MLIETGLGLLVSSAMLTSIRTKNMPDKKKIEKIFEYTKTWVTTEGNKIKKPQFIREDNITVNEKVIGIEYVYRLPLGMPFKKLEYLNENVGVFKDGLHKNVEIEFDEGMMHVNVYEADLPKSWDYIDEKLEGWKVPIGKTYKELIMHDFDSTPHLVGGGTTRYGKTNLVKGIITSLIINHPEDVELYLIDLKAGVEFYRYRNLKQVQMVATNVVETYDLLTEVMMKLEVEKLLYRNNGWSNVTESPIKKRTFVIIDEAGDLVPESFMDKDEKDMHKECQWMLSHVARIGGAFGFRELFFSQYTTADVLPRQIKQNCDAKISFKLQNGYSSEVVLGEGNTQAADLEKIPGRAMFKDGATMHKLQVPRIYDKQMEKLLQDHYVTKRKDITNEQQADEDTNELIQIRDID
ncbi:FtsK/SpoIIIE domain-containing protein [Virgibacillus sp. C22-A2]|uniref:FtsK/SpoIIIE domain-containing protein n=1 Tax=Virgibacillus tibetensis TaxID=3042313 RepID=A0ABU6KBX6_9BACI|nr:FtsK/SpoIIIE domain-containing protein [Virgibacillus sp. C22-A2]